MDDILRAVAQHLTSDQPVYVNLCDLPTVEGSGADGVLRAVFTTLRQVWAGVLPPTLQAPTPLQRALDELVRPATPSAPWRPMFETLVACLEAELALRWEFLYIRRGESGLPHAWVYTFRPTGYPLGTHHARWPMLLLVCLLYGVTEPARKDKEKPPATQWILRADDGHAARLTLPALPLPTAVQQVQCVGLAWVSSELRPDVSEATATLGLSKSRVQWPPLFAS